MEGGCNEVHDLPEPRREHMQYLRPQVCVDEAAQQDVCHTAFLYQELPVEMAEQVLGVARRPGGKREV